MNSECQRMSRPRKVPAAGCLVWACATLLTGCHAPAARIVTTSPGDRLFPCTFVFASQIVEDSAVEAACHPWRCSQTVLAEPAKDLWALGRGFLGKRVVLPLSPPPGPLAANAEPLESAALEAELDQLLGSSLQPASIHLYTDGPEALTELKRLLNQAEQRIDVLMFQWENDAMGAALAACLAAKAGPKLRVRVLVDGGGNLIFGHPAHTHPADVNGVVAQLAQLPYVEVIRIRNPFGRVDHRKLVLVDGRIAWTGGRNFTHQSFFDQRDVSLTVSGPLAAELGRLFEEFWRDQGGKPVAEAAPVPVSVAAPATTNAKARLVNTGPMNHEIEQAVYRAVDWARHHIYFENYTFCDSLLVCKLAAARQRGVDVRVVLTFSDCTKALNQANRVVANRLLQAGVRVYVYPGMTHTKAAAVDGRWAYLGTANFDPLSLRRNLELGIALGACPLVGQVEHELFESDFRDEWELKKPLPLSLKDLFYELVASFCL